MWRRRRTGRSCARHRLTPAGRSAFLLIRGASRSASGAWGMIVARSSPSSAWSMGPKQQRLRFAVGSRDARSATARRRRWRAISFSYQQRPETGCVELAESLSAAGVRRAHPRQNLRLRASQTYSRYSRAVSWKGFKRGLRELKRPALRDLSPEERERVSAVSGRNYGLFHYFARTPTDPEGTGAHRSGHEPPKAE